MLAPGGRQALADELMARPLAWMWELGIRTSHSCQGDPGRRPAYVMLEGQESARRFLTRVAERCACPQAAAACQGMQAAAVPVTGQGPESRWMFFADRGAFQCDPGAGHLRAAVHFPAGQLAAVAGALRPGAPVRRGGFDWPAMLADLEEDARRACARYARQADARP